MRIRQIKHRTLHKTCQDVGEVYQSISTDLKLPILEKQTYLNELLTHPRKICTRPINVLGDAIDPAKTHNYSVFTGT